MGVFLTVGNSSKFSSTTNGSGAVIVNMLKRKVIKKFGATVLAARRRFRISQAELGRMLWPDSNVTDTAAQTRIYRLEAGNYELDVPTTKKLLEVLKLENIDPVTLLPITQINEKRGFVLDYRIFEIYPDLHAYLTLLNQNLDREDIDQINLIIQSIARYLCKTKPQNTANYCDASCDSKSSMPPTKD